MLQLELPHINVLTKIDNLASYGDLPMPLKFYTEARSLDYLEPHLESEQSGGLTAVDVEMKDNDEDEEGLEDTQQKSKFHALNKAILELVEQEGLVAFETLCVEDRQSMWQLLRTIDRAGGYAFGGPEGLNASSAWELAVREGGGGQMMDINDIEERWISRRDEYDKAEQEQWRREAEDDKKRSGAEGENVTAQPSAGRDTGINVVRKS